MEEDRLEYDNLRVIPRPSGDLPPDYITVTYTSSCGEISTRFALHRLLLCHLIGRSEGMISGPQADPYLQMLTAFQSDVILAARSRMNKDEESPDR